NSSDGSARLAVDTTKVFDVSTHALEWCDSNFTMGNISFGSFYVARSLVIWNRESVPLEFSVGSSLAKDDDSELIFSLSRTGAKLFSSVRIEPESHSQIFLRFIFNPQDASKISEDYVEEKNIEIYVNCRLVKDYQKVMLFKALCSLPQMQVSRSDFVFTGAFREEKAYIKGSTADSFTLVNQSQSTLEYHIVGDSMYFGLELVDAEPAKAAAPTTLVMVGSVGARCFSIPPFSSQKFRIVPIVENIEKHTDQLRKVCLVADRQIKYVQDHFVFYNKQRLHEKERIHVRLSFGHLQAFQASHSPAHIPSLLLIPSTTFSF
ncbi:hypothetical protein HDU91_003326, partial [Kappamyces sp. JEL0680]